MSSPITISISAEAVAWYAALISTALLIIKVLEYLRERVNVILECSKDMRVYGEGIYQPDKDYVVITVINKGRCPVTITKVGIITKGFLEK